MDTIAERILEIVERNGGNMSAFARRINVTPAYISKLKNDPSRIPSDRVLIDICREFDINEEWLRYGTGTMEKQRSRSQEIINFAKTSLSGESDDFRRRLVNVLTRLNEDEWELLGSVALKLAEEAKQEKAQADSQPGRIIKIAGRDGSLEEQTLSDEDANEYLNQIDQLPDAGDDL